MSAEQLGLLPSQVQELAIAVSCPILCGLLVSATISFDQKQWYARLRKPAWFPPIWLSNSACVVIFILSGIASWLVWDATRLAGSVVQAVPLSSYLLTMVLIHLWPVCVFHAKRLDYATITCVLLLGTELGTFLLFDEVLGLTLAATLLGPLILWTVGATLVTYALMLRNA
mmetsp:Transcript_7173/g.12366  ORF Transcript_7173/g.12366 Transcript_7173/m.12366 type:complete len:171 (+) Transcript_7173:1-513(+)